MKQNILYQFIHRQGTVRTGFLITTTSIFISVCIRGIVSIFTEPDPTLLFDLIVAATVPLIIAPIMSYFFVTLLVQLVKAEEENAKLVIELQNALATAKTLRGLLPICATCKKIRDDSGYWHQVDVYIREHTEADLSHGICPECAAELKAQIQEQKRKSS